VPGRTHRAAAGERACGIGGCERPAGFATDHEGIGPCRRHGAREPAPKPEALLQVVLASCARNRLPFEAAWRIAAPAALAGLSQPRARAVVAGLRRSEPYWREAYARLLASGGRGQKRSSLVPRSSLV
jgi:hypothetical protein